MNHVLKLITVHKASKNKSKRIFKGIGGGVGYMSQAPKNGECGVQWAPKMGQRPRKNYTILWPETPCMLVDVFFILNNSSNMMMMSFHREDWDS
jgi:hypothetical protein